VISRRQSVKEPEKEGVGENSGENVKKKMVSKCQNHPEINQ
jgi:hypothetical protein